MLPLAVSISFEQALETASASAHTTALPSPQMGRGFIDMVNPPHRTSGERVLPSRAGPADLPEQHPWQTTKSFS